MKKWDAVQVHWSKREKREFRILLCTICASDKYEGTPEEELSFELRRAFASVDDQHRKTFENGTDADVKIAREAGHPFSPYMVNGKIYPRIEIMFNGELVV